MVHYEMYTAIPEMYLFQANDGQHFRDRDCCPACAPRESFILLTDFAAAYPGVNHSWIFHVLEKTELPEFICRFLRESTTTAPHA